MGAVTEQKANSFLNEHFQLFIQKQKEAGYDFEIILNENNNSDENEFFYVRFFNDKDIGKMYKIVLG